MYRHTLDLIRDPVFIHNGNHKIFFANSAYLSLCGKSLEEVQGEYYYRLFPLRDGPFESCQHTEADTSGKEDRECFIEGKDLYLNRCINVIGEGDHPTAHIHIMEKIQTPVHLEQLLDQLPQKIFVKDLNSHYLFGNKAYTDDLGLASPHDIVGKNDFEFFGEELAQQYRADNKRLIESNSSEESEELYTKGEETRLYHTYKSPYRNDQGEVQGIIGVLEDITQVKKAKQERYDTLLQIIDAMVHTVEMRDPYTAGHMNRVADLAVAIGKELEIDEDRLVGLQLAASIHDLGKISIPAELLSKPTRPTSIEYSMLQAHPEAGYNALKNIQFLWPVAEIIRQHHEKLDGSGYPQQLKGDEILLEARILTVADIVESMAFHRPYREALGINVALEEINSQSGTKLDGDVVNACRLLFQEKGFSFLER
jgi:PAS domain S-box-containing protein